MTDFVEQDLGDSRFERVDLTGSSFSEVRFSDARFRKADLTGAELRGCLLRGARLIGVEMQDVEITGAIEQVTVNGVDIGPLVEAELNRRDPERAKMRPDDVAGHQEAWSIVCRRWNETIERARALPPDQLHVGVAGEWSFIQTLRHLNFANAAWVGRMILGDPSPWHPLDLPWDEAPDWDDIPVARDEKPGRDARPDLDVVLAVRADRQAMVDEVMAGLTEDQLASRVSRPEPGWPRIEDCPVKECLFIVINEAWEHRNYAERDLALLERSRS